MTDLSSAASAVAPAFVALPMPIATSTASTRHTKLKTMTAVWGYPSGQGHFATISQTKKTLAKTKKTAAAIAHRFACPCFLAEAALVLALRFIDAGVQR